MSRDPSKIPNSGRLTIVGTGISLGQITAEAVGVLQHADVVMALVGHPPTEAHLSSICREIEDLCSSYVEGKHRYEIYLDMAERVMRRVRQGENVCLAVYGHPGLLATPATEALRMAREEGYAAKMQPGISADGCMYADLGLDPVNWGVQSYEAGAFLRTGKIWDVSALLVLWQIGGVGDDAFHEKYPNALLPELVEKLVAAYGPNHPAIIYEAARLPIESPRIEAIAIGDLACAKLTTASTLLIRPSLTG